jgi:hypothetical protein
MLAIHIKYARDRSASCSFPCFSCNVKSAVASQFAGVGNVSQRLASLVDSAGRRQYGHGMKERNTDTNRKVASL